MESPRWRIITPSKYEWERRALDFVRAALPDHDLYRARSNFEFQADDGAIYEVDLLVLTKQGFWLVECKAWEGRITGDSDACRTWLLDQLEGPQYWPAPKRPDPTLQSTAQLTDKASGDHDFLQVAAIYRGRPDFDVAALVNERVESESVAFLPILRYKPSGLRKREVWERTWNLQRKQDAGEDVGDIPVPPKYASADFLKQDYWRLRGKLDVPKERWISCPYLQTESDPSLVVGWAGWDHLQQATALVAYYEARKREGWDAKRLTPILAGLDQLLPWIHQWTPRSTPSSATRRASRTRRCWSTTPTSLG
jgi:hypothetical protein